MIKGIFLLGSTGSIGQSVLNVVRKDKKKIKIELLTTNQNVRKIYNQALEFKVKKIVIFNKEKYFKFRQHFKKENIKVYFSIQSALKYYKKKSYLTINAISGIDGLEPSINIIKYCKNIAIANKESIICGWNLIENELKKNKTNFIPLDSEHFSIWSLIKNEDRNNIKRIYLTASGGPFLKRKLNNIKNIKPKYALKHPNWNMGKKISIDSATMMNKIFEVIEAVKIFNVDIRKLKIIIHPKSYIHAIVHFNNGLIKLLAHKTTMQIPIANSVYSDKNNFNLENNRFNYELLNGHNFMEPKIENFPLLKILNQKYWNSYFEIILVSLNDALVKKYLANKISYFSIHEIMLGLIKKPYFTKFYKSKPKNIKEIKTMVDIVNNYLKYYLKNYG